MDYLTGATVSALSDYDDGVPDELFFIDLGDIDSSFSYIVPTNAANYGSKTRCGKIIRRFNFRTNEQPERYIKRIYRLLSEECALAEKTVRFLNGGKLVPTRDGKSIAYEFEVGIHDGSNFVQEFSISVPIARR